MPQPNHRMLWISTILLLTPLAHSYNFNSPTAVVHPEPRDNSVIDFFSDEDEPLPVSTPVRTPVAAAPQRLQVYNSGAYTLAPRTTATVDTPATNIDPSLNPSQTTASPIAGNHSNRGSLWLCAAILLAVLIYLIMRRPRSGRYANQRGNLANFAQAPASRPTARSKAAHRAPKHTASGADSAESMAGMLRPNDPQTTTQHRVDHDIKPDTHPD